MTKNVEIYSAHESGVSDSWQWLVMLSRHDTGSFKLSVEQVLADSTEDQEALSYELPVFSTGAELFEFVESSWMNDHEEGLSLEDWLQIERDVRGLDQHLATQVGLAVRLAFNPKAPEKTIEQLQIEQCIDGATWERHTHSGGGAMWAALEDKKKMNQAVSIFFKEYLRQHGTMPQGSHLVLDKEVTFPKPSRQDKAFENG
jgi:hypothetical protein